MLQPLAPVYEVVEPTTEQTTVFDVLFGALSVVGGLALVGLLLGVVMAGILIGLSRLRGRDELLGAGTSATRLDLDAPVPSRPPETATEPPPRLD